MTDKVNPSPDRIASSFATATAIAEAGGSGTLGKEDGLNGWVVTGDNTPTVVAQEDEDIDDTELIGFKEDSSSGLNITIEPGEAFVGGAWLARDENSSVKLPSHQLTTVVVSWAIDETDTVVIDTRANIDDRYPTVPLYRFQTDGNGVVGVEDLRQERSPVVNVAELNNAIGEHSEKESDVHGVEEGSVASTEDVQDVQDNLDEHENSTQDVHGVEEGDIASTENVQDVQDNLDEHENSTQNVHGVGDSDVASEEHVDEEVQNHSEKESDVHGVDVGIVASSEQVAEVASDLSDHENETSGIHGVGNSDIASEEHVDEEIEEHADEESNVHGVEQGIVASTEDVQGVQENLDEHEDETSGIHGVGDSGIASQDDIDAAESSAVSEAESYTDQEINSHSSESSDVHGVGGSDVASEDYVDNTVGDEISALGTGAPSPHGSGDHSSEVVHDGDSTTLDELVVNGNLQIPVRTSDPSNPDDGEIWIVDE